MRVDFLLTFIRVAKRDFTTELLEVGAVPMFDMVPILQVLPGPWNAVKVDANRLKRETDEFFWKQYTEVKRKMAAGIKTGCWLESSKFMATVAILVLLYCLI